MNKEAETPIEFNDLIFAALDHGVDSIADGAGPLIPFVMIVTVEGEKRLQRFVTDQLEEGVEAARNYVEEEKSDTAIYAIAWDGYLTLDEQKCDAILVEAGERDRERGVLLAQRYEQKGMFKKKTHLIGNPALVENPVSRIYGT